MGTYNEFRKKTKYICIGEQKESLKFDSGKKSNQVQNVPI